MKLTSRYAIDCLVMFYEIEMFKESFVPGILNMLDNIENPENITLNLTYSLREDFESIDYDALPEEDYLITEFLKHVDILRETKINVSELIVTSGHDNDHERYDYEPYSIARCRREFTHKYAQKADILMWGETDSLFPKETFQALEQVKAFSEQNSIYKYVISFAYRKMWDAGWKVVEHPKFTDVPFEDTDEWNLKNPASEKCTMSIETMNDINEEYTKDGFDVTILKEPKFDGSCVCFSSDLIKAGVNISQALLMSGEDTSLAESARTLMGNNYIQIHLVNLLRVHNRRYTNKRLYIKGEKNKQGFCGAKDKGLWWKILEEMSKENLHHLKNPQFKFHTWLDYFKKVKETK